MNPRAFEQALAAEKAELPTETRSAGLLDRAMTVDRDEIKYVIDQDRVRAFLRVVGQRLQPHRFTGEGANRLPDAQHYSTTIYFDTASHALFRAATEQPEHNAKLRAREYYDLHSSLAELATDPDQIVRYQPWLFFELKRREGSRTFKHRVRLQKREVVEFFRNSGFDPASAPDESVQERNDRAALAAFAASLSEPLTPSCVVNYRRLAFEDASASLRLTLDLDVAFYTPPVSLWEYKRALVRGSFGRPVAVVPGCLVEVKQRAEQPVWLSRALEENGARPEPFSKFSAASAAVLDAAKAAALRGAIRP